MTNEESKRGSEDKKNGVYFHQNASTATSHFTPIDSVLYYPILNVIREESKKYEYKPDTDAQVVVIDEDGTGLHDYVCFPEIG